MADFGTGPGGESIGSAARAEPTVLMAMRPPAAFAAALEAIVTAVGWMCVCAVRGSRLKGSRVQLAVGLSERS